MANLIDVYNQMASQAQPESHEKTAEQVAVEERMEVINKYASLADSALAKEYGTDYTEDDVVKLAELMFNHDVEYQENMEKVAEAYQLGQIIGQGFLDRVGS